MRALVAPEQLRSELAGAAPLLLDVRWTLAGPDRDAYRAGHLPGAVFCDLDAVLADPPGAGGRHPLPDGAALVEAFRRLGVGPATRVVVYDGGVAAAAARAWWCLRWVGHDDVRVLDGALPAWVATGGPLETGDVTPEPAQAPSRPADAVAPEAGRAASSTVGAIEVHPGMPTVDAEQISAGRVGTLLDARAPERFRGKNEPIDPVAGHIPGARSLPASQLLDAEGRYLPAGALRELFAAAGAAGAGDALPVAAYCGSGVTAAQLVLAAHEAGIDAALYPGSWSHWITDLDRPVATGSDDGPVPFDERVGGG